MKIKEKIQNMSERQKMFTSAVLGVGAGALLNASLVFGLAASAASALVMREYAPPGKPKSANNALTWGASMFGALFLSAALFSGSEKAEDTVSADFNSHADVVEQRQPEAQVFAPTISLPKLSV